MPIDINYRMSSIRGGSHFNYSIFVNHTIRVYDWINVVYDPSEDVYLGLRLIRRRND